jgi:hypothetical protein
MTFYLLDHKQPNTQQWGYPRRGASLSGTCIIHTAECAMDFDGADSSAENCASFINGRFDYGSYHTLVDSDSIIEMIPYEYEAWQDSETNPWAVGLSCAVQADNWHLIPADRRDGIYRNLAWAAADFVTYMATKGITVPLRRITGAQARAKVPGFCAHGDSGVDRHDPGAQFDWALFFTYTAQALGGATLAPQSTTTNPDWTDMFSSLKDFKEAVAESVWGVLEGPRGKKAIQQAVWGFAGGKRNGKAVTVWRDTVDSNTLGRQLIADVEALKEVVKQQAANPGSAVDYDEVQRRVEAGLQAKVDSIVQTQETTTTEIQLQKDAA